MICSLGFNAAWLCFGCNIKKIGRAFEHELRASQTTWWINRWPYAEAELKGLVPMIILTPTVVNDGRKMYIASRPASFMNSDWRSACLLGIQVQRHWLHAFLWSAEQQESQVPICIADERHVPLTTPNQRCPPNRPFKLWMPASPITLVFPDVPGSLMHSANGFDENTSGIIILSIRDSPKVAEHSTEVATNHWMKSPTL